MKTLSKNFITSLVIVGSACAMDDTSVGLEIVSNIYDFNESAHDWQPGFCDYPANEYDQSSYDLHADYTVANIEGIDRNVFALSGNNHSDDLFMYLKKKISGLKPETEYTMIYEVQFASDARESSVGAGGGPGSSVYVKVGASANEPKSVIDETGNYTMNIDKGNQSADGEDMIVIGNIAPPDEADGYLIVTRSNSPSASGTSEAYDKPLNVKTNSKGELWLIVGTDSGYEGVTTLYYTSISVILSTSD